MLRTIVVTISAIILSLVLASIATYLVLNHTEFGRLITGDARGISDPWQTFMSGFWVLLFFISLPTITLVAIFVGVLTRKHAPIAASVAVLPISVISSGLVLRKAWVSVALVSCAAFVTALMHRLGKTRHELNSLTAEHPKS